MGVFTNLIAPTLAATLANVMFSSPLSAVLQVRHSHQLREINPLPYPVITANCVGWLIYSAVTQDPFVFAGNIPGSLLGVFYTFTTVIYAPPNIRDLMMMTFIIFPFVFSTQLFIFAMMQVSADVVQFGIALTNNIILVVYYAAPLSVFYKVVRQRDCSSLYLPLAITNTVNSSMWFIYGLVGLSDPFLWVPNGIGVVLSIFSIVLIAIYPRKTKTDSYLLKLIRAKFSSQYQVNGGNKNGEVVESCV
eukprot:TRINITY_DN3829_c1_g1_i1.p2 TRINITY_DN3829_c1_g1~~TRINITY_DN3829_c1_g1_i1.p2  ORF type:complete len:269 (+),score=11.79 TRINITY_DN3829_c1_g1_i1:65-808(+)